jgi:hypothetical protein
MEIVMTETTTEKPRMRKRAAATKATESDPPEATEAVPAEPKERRPIEDEIKAMRTIDRVLKDLTPSAKSRVLLYCTESVREELEAIPYADRLPREAECAT